MTGRTRGALRMTVRIVAFAAVFVAVGVFVLHLVDEGRAVADRLRAIRPGPMGLALVVWLGSFAAQGLRLASLVPEARVPAVRWGIWVAGAQVLNLAIPGPSGELATAGVMRREAGVGLADATLRALASRVLGLGTIATSAVAAAAWLSRTEGTSTLTLGPAAAVAGAAALAAVSPIVLPRPIATVLRRFPRTPARVLSLLDGFAAIPLGAWLRATGWSVVAVVAQSGGAWLAFRGAGVLVHPVAAVFLQGIASVAALAAIALPAGAGAVDGAMIAAFPGATGASMGDAVVADLAVRLVQLTALLAAVPAALRMVGAATAAGPEPGQDG